MSDAPAVPPTPAPPVAPKAGATHLAGKHLSWPTWTLADRHARTVQRNLGFNARERAVVVAHFADPPGWGFAAPDRAFMRGVTGGAVRDGVTLDDDSPLPTLNGPVEASAADVRARLEARMDEATWRTVLDLVEEEIAAVGGNGALDAWRAERAVSRAEGALVDALAALGWKARDVADLFADAQGDGPRRREARRERRVAVEAARAAPRTAGS